jgi:hypothetical protein
MNYRLLQKAGLKGKLKENKRTAKFGVGRPNELVFEFSATRRLYQGVQPAGGIDLAHDLVINGLWEWAWERLEETLQGERDRWCSGRGIVFLRAKESLLSWHRLSISEPDEVQDALGNSVRGARSFGNFEAGVNHVDGADAKQMERELDLHRTSILWSFFTPNQSQNRKVVRKKGAERFRGGNAHCLSVCYR